MDTRLEYDVFDQMVERLLRPLAPLCEHRGAADRNTDAFARTAGTRSENPAHRR